MVLDGNGLWWASGGGFAGGGDGGAAVGGCEWMWMWRFLSTMIFFSFFVSGGCGMGGGFLVSGWAVGFVMTVGSVASTVL